MKAAKRFRDELGRYCSAIRKAELLRAGKATMVYANGKRIPMKKSDFIIQQERLEADRREKNRLRRKYARQKIQRKTGIKVEANLIAPVVVEVGKGGKQIIVEPKAVGGIKTSIRWGFVTVTKDGKYRHRASGAKIFGGRVSLNQALDETDFFNYMGQVIEELRSGELRLKEDGIENGIHYFQFREDNLGQRIIDNGTIRDIEGYDVLSFFP